MNQNLWEWTWMFYFPKSSSVNLMCSQIEDYWPIGWSSNSLVWFLKSWTWPLISNSVFYYFPKWTFQYGHCILTTLLPSKHLCKLKIPVPISVLCAYVPIFSRSVRKICVGLFSTWKIVYYNGKEDSVLEFVVGLKS